MTRVNLDFSDSVDLDFAPIPAGRYRVRVSSIDIRQSKSSQFQYVNWEMEVDAGDYVGRKLWTNTSFSPKALWKLKETLIAFGEDPQALAGEIEVDFDKYANARATAFVDLEGYLKPDGSKVLRNVVNQLDRKSVV